MRAGLQSTQIRNAVLGSHRIRLRKLDMDQVTIRGHRDVLAVMNLAMTVRAHEDDVTLTARPLLTAMCY